MLEPAAHAELMCCDATCPLRQPSGIGAPLDHDWRTTNRLLPLQSRTRALRTRMPLAEPFCKIPALRCLWCVPGSYDTDRVSPGCYNHKNTSSVRLAHLGKAFLAGNNLLIQLEWPVHKDLLCFFSGAPVPGNVAAIGFIPVEVHAKSVLLGSSLSPRHHQRYSTFGLPGDTLKL